MRGEVGEPQGDGPRETQTLTQDHGNMPRQMPHAAWQRGQGSAERPFWESFTKPRANGITVGCADTSNDPGLGKA